MTTYISINFNNKLQLVKNPKNEEIVNKYEFDFLNYKLVVNITYKSNEKGLYFVSNVYYENKLIKTKQSQALLKDFNNFISLGNLRSSFLLFFRTIHQDLLNKTLPNKLHLNLIDEAMNSDILFHDKITFIVFKDLFVFNGLLKHKDMSVSNDVFIGTKDECEEFNYDIEFESESLIDYLLSTKEYVFKNEILLDLLYMKGE